MRQLARAAADGARRAGAEVRVRRVAADDGPGSAADGTADVPLARHEDLRWADGLIFATPTYYGNVSFPIKQFIDSTSHMWKQGELAGRAVTGITSSTSLHGGREATLLALYNSMYHWGAIVVPGGLRHGSPGANPYGVSSYASQGRTVPEHELAAGRVLGGRLANVSACVRSPEPSPGPASGLTRVAVVYYPAARGTRSLAEAIAHGARAEGAEVRLRRVTDLVPAESKPDSCQRSLPRCVADGSPVATLADLEWADAIAFGAPARIGVVAPQLAYFIEAAEPLRAAGKLAGKTATAFTVTSHDHTGSESALLSLYNAMHHWGAVIVAPGYTDPVIAAAGGNPYGSSHVMTSGREPTQRTLAAACYQGRRLAVIAARLRAGTATGQARPREIRVMIS